MRVFYGNLPDLRGYQYNNKPKETNIFNDSVAFSVSNNGTASQQNNKTDQFFREIEFPSVESKNTQKEQKADLQKNITATNESTHKSNNSNNKPDKVIAKSSKKDKIDSKNNSKQVNNPRNSVSSSTSQPSNKKTKGQQPIDSSLGFFQQPSKKPKIKDEEETIQGRQSYLEISEQLLLQGQQQLLKEPPRKKLQLEKKPYSQFFEEISKDVNGLFSEDLQPSIILDNSAQSENQKKQQNKKQPYNPFTKELEKMHKAEDIDIPRLLGQLNQQLRNSLIGEKVEDKLFKSLKEFEEARVKSFPLYQMRHSKDPEQKQLLNISIICDKTIDGSVIPILKIMLKYGKLKHFKIVATLLQCQFMRLNIEKKYELIKSRIQEAKLMLEGSEFIQSEKKQANEILESLLNYAEVKK